MSNRFEPPNADELLELFSLELTQSNPSDGYWYYSVTDEHGTKLMLAIDIIRQSIWTQLSFQNRIIATVYHEGAIYLKPAFLEGQNILIGECKSQNATTSVEIHFQPTISLQWSTLIE